MDYFQFINTVIERGIIAVNIDYKDDENKRNGAIAGFEACRGKLPEELNKVWKEVEEYIKEAHNKREVNTYWWFRAYQLEVEWVCNVVSAMLYNQGKKPVLSWLPTGRGVMAAAYIIGEICNNNKE